MSLPLPETIGSHAVLLVLAGLVGIYVLTSYIRSWIFIRKHGCKETLSAPENWWTGSIPLLLRLFKLKRSGDLIDYIHYYVIEVCHAATIYVRLGGKRIVITVDPENTKAILATQFNDFALGSRHAHFKPLLGDGIFTLDGEGWKHSRAMLRPQFSREQVGHVNMLEPHLQVLGDYIRHFKGKTFDLQDLFFKLTVDTASEFLFGESVSSLENSLELAKGNGPLFNDEDGKASFAEAFNTSQTYLASRAIFQMFYFIVDNFEFRKSCRSVHKFAKYYVNKALAYTPSELEEKSKSSYIFLYELAKHTRNPTVLQDQLLNILVAGRDTTAGLLSFVFYELARNPEIWNKLKEDIYSHFGTGEDLENITFESLKKSEYLKFVINEALRLYPSVPVNYRVATKDTTLPVGGGPDGLSPVYIDKGATVAYSVYATHRMEEYYGKDSKVFRPERWATIGKLGWAYLPFNGGPRICLGQQFALTEASYIIVRLAQMFPNLVSKDTRSYPPQKCSHLTMSLQHGLDVQFH